MSASEEHTLTHSTLPLMAYSLEGSSVFILFFSSSSSYPLACLIYFLPSTPSPSPVTEQPTSRCFSVPSSVFTFICATMATPYLHSLSLLNPCLFHLNRTLLLFYGFANHQHTFLSNVINYQHELDRESTRYERRAAANPRCTCDERACRARIQRVTVYLELLNCDAARQASTINTCTGWWMLGGKFFCFHFFRPVLSSRF